MMRYVASVDTTRLYPVLNCSLEHRVLTPLSFFLSSCVVCHPLLFQVPLRFFSCHRWCHLRDTFYLEIFSISLLLFQSLLNCSELLSLENSCHIICKEWGNIYTLLSLCLMISFHGSVICDTWWYVSATSCVSSSAWVDSLSRESIISVCVSVVFLPSLELRHLIFYSCLPSKIMTKKSFSKKNQP